MRREKNANERRHVTGPVMAAMILTTIPSMFSTAQEPVGSSFTYQGQLKQGGSPANGLFDLELTLWDDPLAGEQVGATLTELDVPVAQGLFTVELDFGDVFDGTALWLELTVAPTGAPDSTTLAPRQRLSAAPYALSSARAGLADRSAIADDAELLDGFDSSEFLGVGGGEINGELTVTDIRATGNLAIGTGNPETPLHIFASSTTDFAQFEQDTTASVNLHVLNPNRHWEFGIASSGDFKINDSTAGKRRLTIDGDGNPAIGPGNPETPLHIFASSTTDFAQFEQDMTASVNLHVLNPNRHWESGITSSGDFKISDSTAGEMRLTIDGNGHVAINGTVEAANITPWTTYIPETQGMGVVIGTEVSYHVVGDTMEIIGNIEPGALSGSIDIGFDVPSGFAIDGSKLPTGSRAFLGTWISGNTGSVTPAAWSGPIFYDGSDSDTLYLTRLRTFLRACSKSVSREDSSAPGGPSCSERAFRSPRAREEACERCSLLQEGAFGEGSR